MFIYIILKVQSEIKSLKTRLLYSTILNHLNELKWNNISCQNLCSMMKSWATRRPLFLRLRWLYRDGGSKSCSKLVSNHWTNTYLPINMKLKTNIYRTIEHQYRLSSRYFIPHCTLIIPKKRCDTLPIGFSVFSSVFPNTPDIKDNSHFPICQEIWKADIKMVLQTVKVCMHHIKCLKTEDLWRGDENLFSEKHICFPYKGTELLWF